MQFLGPTAPEAGPWTGYASDMTAMIGAYLVANQVHECAQMLARDYPRDALAMTAAVDLLPQDWIVTIDCPTEVPYDRVGMLLRLLIKHLGITITTAEGIGVNPQGLTKPQILGTEPVLDEEANLAAMMRGDLDWRDGLTAREVQEEMHNRLASLAGANDDDFYAPTAAGFGAAQPIPRHEREAIYEPVWHRAVWLLQAHLLVDTGLTWDTAAIHLAMETGTYPSDGAHVTQPGYWDLPAIPPSDPRLWV